MAQQEPGNQNNTTETFIVEFTARGNRTGNTCSFWCERSNWRTSGLFHV